MALYLYVYWFYQLAFSSPVGAILTERTTCSEARIAQLTLLFIVYY
jgi:hypothetical protein